MRFVAGVAAVLLAAAFLALDPARTITGEAALRAGQGALAAFVALAACLGAGGAALDGIAPPTGEVSDTATRWVRALALGIGLHSLGMLAFLLGGVSSPVAMALLLVASGAGWLARPRVVLPRVGPLALVLGAVLLAPALFDALAPPTDTDETYYQLAIPRYWLDHGALPGGMLHPEQSRPSPVQLVHAVTLALGGEAGPRLWHLAVTVALVLGVRSLAEARFGAGRGDLPALALLGSFSVLREAGLAYPNVPVALWLVVAAAAALDGRVRELAAAAGFALAAKYTAAPAIAGLFLVALWDGRRRPGPVLLAGVAALLPCVPWWGRNALAGLHPLFPFAGWPEAQDFVFVYPQKYGAGHSWTDALLLPWRVLVAAEPDSFVFYGRLSLLWAGLTAAVVASWRRPDVRRLALVFALVFVAWGSSAQLLRYLVPGLGIAALAAGVARPGWAYALLFVVSLPANLAPTWVGAASRAAVVTGHEDADAYLEREMPAWPAVRYLRDEVPTDEPVALLNAWAGYWVRQPWVLGSVEDHVPTRHWLWAHGDDALGALRREGVRWLLVGEIKYLRKSYAFLPEGVFQGQFRDPQAHLDRLLLRDATRVFGKNRYAVWRLDDPEGPR